jgi:hypothetical protein
MVKFLAIVFVLCFIPFIIISKAQQLREGKQSKIRYFIFVFVVILLILTLIRRI